MANLSTQKNFNVTRAMAIQIRAEAKRRKIGVGEFLRLAVQAELDRSRKA